MQQNTTDQTPSQPVGTAMGGDYSMPQNPASRPDGDRRQRTISSSSDYINKQQHLDTFVTMNERPVDDISLEFFYKPHTITLLAVSIIGVMYLAFVR